MLEPEPTRPSMKLTTPFRSLPVAAIAAAALFGVTGSGHAQQTEIVAMGAASLAQVQGPVFVPGADPRFAQVFAEMNGAASADSDLDVAAIAPVEQAVRSLGSGSASYYADRFNGQRTASGERFSNSDLTAAHRTLPFGSRVRVTNPDSGESVVVRINDRGPFTRGRTIDLSRAAAQQVGIVRAGHGTVELELIAD